MELLKDTLDRQLNRNLALKRTTGPLGKSHVKKKTVRQGMAGWTGKASLLSKSSDYQIGYSATPLKSAARKLKHEHEEELQVLKKQSIVRGRSFHLKVNDHIQSRVSRMSNHRITIRPISDCGATERVKRLSFNRKSSILVTGMEESEDRRRALHKQQSRVLVENMMQWPSHQQRVLQRLSLDQLETISIAEATKLSQRNVNMKIVLGEAEIVQDEVEILQDEVEILQDEVEIVLDKAEIVQDERVAPTKFVSVVPRCISLSPCLFVCVCVRVCV